MISKTAGCIIDYCAKLIGIQKVKGYGKDGKILNLVICKALREVRERQADIWELTEMLISRIAGHSIKTKEQYYKKSNFEESKKVIRKHHPFFKSDKEK